MIELQKALKADPRSAAAYYFLGVAQNALGFPFQAKSSWARALELQPQMTDAQLALADLDANSGNYDEALRLADDALMAHPKLLSADLIQAKVLLAKGDTKNGEPLLQAVLDRDPASLAALKMLVSLRVREKRSQEVLPRVSKLVEQYPQNARLHFLLAVVYFSVRDLEKAEASAKQATMLDRQGLNQYSLLAAIHQAQGATEKAKADLQAAIDGDPRNVANYMVLEMLYEKEGNWERAKKLCEKAHEVDPGSPAVANDLAYFYLEHGGDVNLALSLAQAARQKMLDSPNTADTLGWAYYKSGLPELAIVQLKQSVQKVPNNPIYQYHLGMAYIAAGHLEPAKRSLQQVLIIRENPDFPNAASARAALDKISKQPH